MENLCYICLVFVKLLCLFIATLWSLGGKGQTYWLSFVMLNCVFVTFPCGILGQVRYLIVLIPDLCCTSYFFLLPIFYISLQHLAIGDNSHCSALTIPNSIEMVITVQ